MNRTKDNSNFHVKYENGEEEFPVPRKHLSFEDLGLQAKISADKFENQNSSDSRDSFTATSRNVKKDESPSRISSPKKSSSSMPRDNSNDNNNDGSNKAKITRKDSVAVTKYRLENEKSKRVLNGYNGNSNKDKNDEPE